MALYHYCSIEVFVAIASRRRIRLSMVSLSNDYLEGRWFHRVFRSVTDEKISDVSWRDKLIEFMQWYLGVAGAVAFCLSEEGDLLSQWRAYADDARGVAIGFHQPSLEGLTVSGNVAKKCLLEKIEYDLPSQKYIVATILDKMAPWLPISDMPRKASPGEFSKRPKGQIFERLIEELISAIPTIYKLKNPAFTEEREWRLIVPLLVGAIDEKMSNLLSCEYRHSRDLIIPFVEVDLEKVDSIEEIVLGPRNRTPPEVVKAFLERSGLQNTNVRQSTASYQ